MQHKIWRVRKLAVKMIRERGWSQSKVARHLGYNQSTIQRWYQKWFQKGKLGYFNQSTRPRTLHPKTIPWDQQLLVRRLRKETDLCHQRLSILMAQDYGIKLGPITVYRIIKRAGLIKSKKRYQRKNRQIPYVYPKEAGQLVQVDTKYVFKRRLFQYTFVDVATRYPVAFLSRGILSQELTIKMTREALKEFPFKVRVMQTDNGLEFQSALVKYLARKKIAHRYIRIRTPRHNAFVERFHRTIDDELWKGKDLRLPLPELTRLLKTYLTYFRTKRIHLGLDGKTPMQKLKELTYA